MFGKNRLQGIVMHTHRRLKGAESRTGFLLILPAIIAFCLMIVYPLGRSVTLAFFRYDLFTPRPVFAGLANFRRIASSPQLMGSWLRTMFFVATTTSLTFILGLTWALILNQPFRGRNLIRPLSLLPWVFPSVVTAFLWSWIFNGQYGVLNAVLLQLGIINERIIWLATGPGAMAAVIITKMWISIPLFMAFFLAGLQSIPNELCDALRVDGGHNWHLLRYVALPHLRYTMVIVSVIGAMGNLQEFDRIYAITQGGPVRATTVLSIEVYRQAFENWNTGLAAAIGVIWILTLAGPVIIYLRSLFRSDVR